MVRKGKYDYLISFKHLLNQYRVDMYAKIETERPTFIFTNHSNLRAENYIHLQDALRNDDGRVVILPSSFSGGLRYVHEPRRSLLCLQVL